MNTYDVFLVFIIGSLTVLGCSLEKPLTKQSPSPTPIGELISWSLLTSTPKSSRSPIPTETPTQAASPTQTVEPSLSPTTMAMVTSTSELLTPSTLTALPTPTLFCGPPSTWVVYEVQANDTLSALAIKTNTTIELLQKANCLVSTIIFVDQKLYLPFIPLPSPTPITTPAPQPLASLLPTETRTSTLIPTARPTNTSIPAPTATATATPSPIPTPTPTTPTFTPVPPTPTPTLFLPTAPPPGDPRLDIIPSSGPIGTVYTLTLENFKPNEDVIIERTHLSTGEVTFITLITVDEMGNSSVQFVSQPGDAPGTYIVSARGMAGTLVFGQFEIN